VSAFEPQSPAQPKVDMPDFMVVLRGFDRRQVETWAAEVASQIEQERLRADEAERTLYRMQIENKGQASFSHLGSHVASILEEAGRSSENMLADAAERAQEAIDAAEAEAAEIIKAAEHRAGEIEGEARRTLEDARAEGARVEEDALQAAEEMRGQAEQDARTVLEEARDATDMIWQEAERERVGVEAETIRLEALRHRSLEQLGRVYGHLESVLDEVRAGIGRVEEEEDEAEAAAAAAARLGVEPPASSPDERPQFPEPRQPAPAAAEVGAEGGLLSATRPDAPAGAPDAPAGTSSPAGPAATDPEITAPAGPATDAEITAPSPTAADGAATPTGSVAGAEATQPVPAAGAAERASDGEGPADPEATQRLEPVGGKGRPAKPAAKDDNKDQP
jgi:cell division septum initiation protein DivIVA